MPHAASTTTNCKLSTAWITYKLERKAIISDICLKLTGWRLRSYPLEIYAGKKLIWSGETERSLGYIHLTPTQQVKTNEITIRLKGTGKDKDAFGGIVEVVSLTYLGPRTVATPRASCASSRWSL